ncbi:MAG: hypothetical protein ACI9MR_000821 [Myxococcota bacterium]|jgi:hypothetical protein
MEFSTLGVQTDLALIAFDGSVTQHHDDYWVARSPEQPDYF